MTKKISQISLMPSRIDPTSQGLLKERCISRLRHKYTVPLFSELLSCQRFSELRHERTCRSSMNLAPTWATRCAASKGTILNVRSHASGLNGISRRLLGSATTWRSESRKKRGAQLPHYVFHVPKHRHAMHFGGHSRKGEARIPLQYTPCT